MGGGGMSMSEWDREKERVEARVRSKDNAKAIARGVAIIAVLGSLLFMCSVPDEEEVAERAAKEEEKARKAAADKIQGFHCLSGWDGSHRGLVRQVKARLRDPDSFEHIETRIAKVENGTHAIFMTYHARNGFGGMNVEKAVGAVDHDTCTASLLLAGVGE